MWDIAIDNFAVYWYNFIDKKWLNERAGNYHTIMSVKDGTIL